jgi:hypothetical protein
VPGVLEECAAAGVRSVLVYSGGFADEGDEKRGLQDEVAAIAARTGIRVGGPNSVGFLNVTGGVCATFSPAIDFAALPAQRAAAGPRIGIVSQSGGLGFAIFNRGLVRHLAFSHVVNTGNEADIDASDVLDFLVDDPATQVVCMFLESVRRGDRFRAAAERALAAGKPIVVAKVGRSAAGRRAALSHTASLTVPTPPTIPCSTASASSVDDQDAMLTPPRRWRCVRRSPAGESASSPSRAGRRLIADTLEARGSPCRPCRPPCSRSGNTCRPTAPPSTRSTSPPTRQTTACAAEVLAAAGASTPWSTSPRWQPTRLPAERERLEARPDRDAPILFYSYPLPAPAAAATLAAIGLPLYTSLAGVARGLDALATWHAARRPRPEPAPSGDVAAVTRALDAAGETLCEYEAAPILAAYGIHTAPARLARAAAEAAQAAAELGFPVALKVQSPDIPHKTEAGGVALGLGDADAVARAFASMDGRVRAALPEAASAASWSMAARGVEMLAGVVADPGFGPQVSVGLGGILVELLRDIRMAPAPLAAAEADELVGRLAGAALLDGWRGAPAADRRAFADLAARLSRLAHDFADRILEIELNPVIVHPRGRGVTVVDALIRQRPKEPT